MTNVNLSKIREKLLGVLNGYAEDFACECEDNFANYVSGCEYICDLVSQFADSHVDVYYNQLLDFVKENPHSLEEVIEEGLYDPSVNYRFWDHVTAAQYMSIEQEINESLPDIIRYLAVSYLWRKSEKDYTESELRDLEDYLDPYAMPTFDEIAEAVDNFIEAV